MRIILLLLVFSVLAFGQEVRLQVSAPATLDQVNVADLDVSRLTDLPLLFSITITSDVAVEVKMHFQVFAKVGSEKEDIFADVWSSSFKVDRILSFTNQDLASGRTGIKSDKDRTRIYEDKIKRIKEIAQSTGKLPAGTYRFLIQILNASETYILDTWEKIYEITAPSRIDLVSPGYQSEVRTQFPIFKWIAPYLKEFEIYVYEKLPSQATPEEVVSGDKNLRWKFKTNDTQIQYPREALPLEDGKTYFWFVKSQIYGSRGTEEIRSEIWSFNIKLGQSITPQITLTPEQARNLRELINVLNQSGNTEIASLLSKISSDLVILINGRPATSSELAEILELLKSNRYEVIEIEEK